jgi:hypothetical protein
MFDDCNNFFKGKADGRVVRAAPPVRLVREGVETALLLSAIGRACAQYLHRSSVILS